MSGSAGIIKGAVGHAAGKRVGNEKEADKVLAAILQYLLDTSTTQGELDESSRREGILYFPYLRLHQKALIQIQSSCGFGCPCSF